MIIMIDPGHSGTDPGAVGPSGVKEKDINLAVAERLENLCKELSSLTTWVKTLVVAMLTSLVGFIIWYIQSLPR